MFHIFLCISYFGVYWELWFEENATKKIFEFSKFNIQSILMAVTVAIAIVFDDMPGNMQ